MQAFYTWKAHKSPYRRFIRPNKGGIFEALFAYLPYPLTSIVRVSTEIRRFQLISAELSENFSFVCPVFSGGEFCKVQTASPAAGQATLRLSLQEGPN